MLSKAISYIGENAYTIDSLYSQLIDILEPDYNKKNDKENPGDDSKTIPKLDRSEIFHEILKQRRNDKKGTDLPINPTENSQVIVEQQIGAAKPIVGVAQQVTNAGGSIPAKADTNSILSYNPVTNDDDSTMVSYNDSKPYVDGQNNNSSVISVSDNKGLNNIIPGVAAVVAGTGVGLAVKGKLDEDKDEEYEFEG